jgi:NAD(P)-dependent dehydrogenase (short-subunit alcohol dehydrogenase family)
MGEKIMSTPKIALVTGANKGIGFETARQLGKLGITVILGARDSEKGEAAAAVLRTEDGITAHAVKLDVDNAADREAAKSFIERQFGHLDILVNNAGVSSSEGGWGVNTTSVASQEELHRVFETNFFSVVALTQLLLPLIRKSEGGRIVNLSSILGSQTLHATPGSPIYAFKNFAYDASKTALNSFTIHLAAELKDTPIKVNSVHPGWVKTDMGTDAAPMEIPDGAKTSVQLATIKADGPTGGYFHMGDTLPW